MPLLVFVFIVYVITLIFLFIILPKENRVRAEEKSEQTQRFAQNASWSKNGIDWTGAMREARGLVQWLCLLQVLRGWIPNIYDSIKKACDFVEFC